MKTERLDPLQRAFICFEDSLNSNAHQLVVITGHLQLPWLREAINRTVQEFELCTAGVSADGKLLTSNFWRPEEIPLHHSPFAGTISFSDASFRQAMMRLSQWNPVRWRRRPPVQFFYVTDASGSRSALMFNSHHGIADAKSDTLLLERLMQNYGAVASGPTPIRAMPPGVVRPFTPLHEIKQHHGTDRGRTREFFAGMIELVRDLATRWDGFRSPGSRNRIDEVDFVYHELDAQTEQQIRSVAQRSGHTINTVIMAALYRVARASQGARSRRIKILCPVSLRNIIDPSYRENFQNFMVPCSLTFERSYENTAALFSSIKQSIGRIRDGGIFRHVDRLPLLVAILGRAWLTGLRPKILRVMQGSNACYSNPGVVTEKLDCFGSESHRVIEYAGFGLLIPPYDFILYTPQFRDRLFFNAIYRRNGFTDISSELILPLKAAIAKMAVEFEVGVADTAGADVAHHAEPRVMSSGSRA
jgi:NRPS condensation-like uncharacterized protein